MSLRYEQYWALQRTREFLRDLMTTDGRPKTVKEMKRRAYSCLKHFPCLDENGKPYFSKDPFGPDGEDYEIPEAGPATTEGGAA